MSQTTTTEVNLDIIRPVSKENDQTLAQANQPLPIQVFPAGLSKVRSVVIIATLTGTTVVSSFSNSLLSIVLPRMAKDVDLPVNLLLWPASVYS